LSLEFDDINNKNCHILLGINESGKSNILRAISILDLNNEVKYDKDCDKESRRYGEPIEFAFTFELANQDVKAMSTGLKEDGFSIDLSDIKEIDKIITIDRSSEKKVSWIPKTAAAEYKVNIIEDQEEQAKILSTQEMIDLINEKISDTLEKLEPKVIYWKAAPEYLISNPINLDQFKDDQNQNIPLKNLFYLTGIKDENLENMIEAIKQDHAERRQLEKSLSEKATKHINTIWPEHKVKLDIGFESSGICTVHVVDKDCDTKMFEMDERSDGFKQFVSILLTISAENRSDILENSIILLDEPDRSLHPSSISYLRDELLEIAKKNIVLIASHSIFIVDRKNLERHIKVKKEETETRIEKIKADNPLGEEIIYRALGTSIYEIIEPYILVFEGTTDRDLYEAFSKKFKAEKNISNLKTISASGVNEIRKYLKFFNQKTITGIVLVDSDKQGRDVLRAIKDNEPQFENTSFEILNIVNLDKSEATVEDLLPVDIIKSSFKAAHDIEIPNLKDNIPYLSQIIEYKRSKNIDTDRKMELLKTNIAQTVFSDMRLDKEQIKEKYSLYFDFFTNLNKKIGEVQTITR